MTAYNPYFADDHGGGRPRITFSLTEVRHLALAVLFLTAAFAFVLNDRGQAIDANPLDRIMAPWTLYLASFLAVGSGFVLHELAHKVLAQHYGHWAEFRGQFTGLVISLAFALGVGFLFAAPGAVMIWGRVTAKENGLISLMGPLVNFVIALLALPFTFATDADDLLPKTMGIIALVNAFLCVFNLLPILNLDGRKIWYWNRFIYLVSMLLALSLLVFMALWGLWLN